MKSLKFIAVFVLFVLMSFWLKAQVEDCLPKPPSSNTSGSKAFVHDFSESFSAADERRLSQRFNAFRKQTSNEIILVTSDDLCGLSPWSFGIKIGNAWNVGQSQFDNGLVIVYKPKRAGSRGEIGIATGRGLEGALPDGALKLIVDKEMIPSFKKGRITQGIEKGLGVMQDIIKEEYSYANYKSKVNSFPKEAWIPIIIIVLFLVIWLYTVYNYAKTNNISFWKALVLTSQTRNTHRGGWGDFNRGRGGFGGYVGRGGGGFNRGGGGGGFGGFGGGSFGGGGASGSW